MTKNSSILIVDDELVVRQSISEDLREKNFDTETAEDGATALAKLQAKHFDLVITDLKMAGLGGLEVLEKIHELDADIGVIILTGYGDMESAINALRLGADDYLCKPCNNEELICRMNKCLEKRALQKRIKIYEDLLPICSICKKIRDDSGKAPGTGKWMPVEEYFARKTNVMMTHSVCNDCLKSHYSGFLE